MAAAAKKKTIKPRHKRRRWPLFAWGLLILLGLGGVLYGVDYAMSEGKVPRGVTVGGVDIGGLPKDQAEQRLVNNLGDVVRQPVTVNAGNMSSIVDPRDSGLQVDWSKTVDQAGQQPLNPITRIRSFFQTREVGIVSQFHEGPLATTLRRVTDELTREPENAHVSITEKGKPKVVADKPGQTVNRDLVDARVREHWLNKDRTVHVDADVVKSNIPKSAAEEMVEKVIKPATSGDVVFKGRDHVDGTLRPEDMAHVVSFNEKPGKKPGTGTFEPVYSTEAAKKILQPQLAETEVEFRNAGFNFKGRDIEVIPHQDGVEIEWDKTLGDLGKKVLDVKHREHKVFYEDKKAEYTTEEAEKAHFDDVVSSFTTHGFSASSGVNIRRVAEMVDGAIVLPGETFSLNGHTGPRGKEQGFVESGIIIDGQAGEAVGGGISQFATTLYNASYFAGMEDVAHTPHSYYISRYPAGREATVYEGAIDLQFKNPFDTPVLIEASAGSDSVTVRMRGVKQVEVDSIAGSRTNPTKPEVRKGKGDKCIPSGGAPGFTVTDTRVIKDLRGKEIKRETQTTVYDPQPIVRCS